MSITACGFLAHDSDFRIKLDNKPTTNTAVTLPHPGDRLNKKHLKEVMNSPLSFNNVTIRFVLLTLLKQM